MRTSGWIPDVHPDLSQCRDHVLWSNAPGKPCCAKASETVLQSMFLVRPGPGSCLQGGRGQSQLRGVRWAVTPCNVGGNGLYPASSLQPHFEDMGNCLSNVTIKSHFSGIFNCSKENSIATLGPTGRTMSMLNTLHQILCSYPEALAEQTSPSRDTS